MSIRLVIQLRNNKTHRKVEGSMRRIILSVIVLAALAGTLQAAPFQTLGLLRTPDAYVLPHKAAELVLVGYYRNVERPDWVNLNPEKSEGFFPYGMVGVGLLDRVELGFFGGDDIYFMNAKVKLIQETEKFPQISIGMDNIFSTVNHSRAQDYKPYWDPETGDDGAPSAQYDPYDLGWIDHPDKTDYEHYSPYIVASKQAVFGGVSWMFNLGVGANRFTGQVPRSRWFSGSFASIEISPFRDFAIQGEYDGKDFNAGVKYSFDNFTVKFCGEAVEDLAKESEGSGWENNLRIALGVSYLFDKYAESQRRPDIRPIVRTTDLDNTTVVTNGEVPVTTQTGTEVAITTPGTTTPQLVETSAYKELSPEAKELLAELRSLREERQKAQKALEDLRKWLQELKEQNE